MVLGAPSRISYTPRRRRAFSGRTQTMPMVTGASSLFHPAFPIRMGSARQQGQCDQKGSIWIRRSCRLLGLSGTDTGIRLFFDGRAYTSLGTGGRLVLAGRVQLGSVIGPPPDGVTPDFLFFSGGAGTVRGQPFESLGIPVGTGVAGGKSFLGFSGEVRGKDHRHPVAGRVL